MLTVQESAVDVDGQTVTVRLVITIHEHTPAPQPTPEPTPEPIVDALPDLPPVVPPVASPVPTPAPSVDSGSTGEPFYSHDFSDGARTDKHGFAWLSSSANVTVEDAPLRPGQKALAFAHRAKPIGEDSTAQQNYDMGRELREVWVAYDLYIPHNFALRDDVGGENNKFHLLFADSNVGDNLLVGAEYLRVSDTDSRVKLLGKTDNNQWSALDKQAFKHPTFLTTAMRGTWQRVREHVRIDSAAGVHDGVYECRVNDVLVWSAGDTPIYNSGRNNYVRKGYLMGWANMGFTEETVFYLANPAWYDRDPMWPGFVRAAGQTAVSDATTWESANVPATFQHTRTSPDDDVFIATYVSGVTGGAAITVQYAGITAEQVASHTLSGVRSGLWWHRVRAAQLGAQVGPYDVTCQTTRAVQMHAINVQHAGTVRPTVDTAGLVQGAFSLAALPYAPGDAVIAAYATVGGITIAPTGRALGRTIGGTARVLVTAAHTPAARPLTANVADSATAVCGAALHIRAAVRHPHGANDTE